MGIIGVYFVKYITKVRTALIGIGPRLTITTGRDRATRDSEADRRHEKTRGSQSVADRRIGGSQSDADRRHGKRRGSQSGADCAMGGSQPDADRRHEKTRGSQSGADRGIGGSQSGADCAMGGSQPGATAQLDADTEEEVHPAGTDRLHESCSLCAC
jgi:hypothetical protein